MTIVSIAITALSFSAWMAFGVWADATQSNEFEGVSRYLLVVN